MRAQKVRAILIGLSGFCSLVCGATIFAQSDTKWTADQQNLLDVARSLSKTTLVDGEGWESYGEFLHADFNRWTEGRAVIDRESSIKMIREWWEAGNRQSSSEEKPISVQIAGDTGVIRKTMSENYVDGEGKNAGSFSGYVTQVWVRENDNWKLLAATIQMTGE